MPRFDNAYALIIGINSYQHINPLSKAVNDAVDVRNLLIDENTCGYHPDNVCLLTDTQATKLVFFETMNWLAEKADEAATVTIFFSGHGGQSPTDGTEGYLLLHDTNPWSAENPSQVDVGRLGETAVTTRAFTAALNEIKAQKITVIFDACHSGGFANPKSPFFNRPLLQRGLPEQTYEALKRGRGRVIIASCTPDQVSWEQETMRNGIFTDALLKGLRGEAASKDGVQVLDLFTYVSKQVPEAIQSIISPFTGKPAEQNPYLKAEAENNFIIALPPARIQTETTESETKEADYDIFVSHAPGDGDQVDFLVRKLRQDGFKVWLADEELAAGDPIALTLAEAIEKSSHVIVCLSQRYLAAEWSDFETAVTQTLDINAQKRKLIPILLEDCKVPIQLNHLNHANLSGDHNSSKWGREYKKVIKNPQKTKKDREKIATEAASDVTFIKEPILPQATTPLPSVPNQPLDIKFQNQTRALWAIEQQLISSEPYVFITATAQMGKSYLLNELKRRCTTGELQPNPTNGDDGPQKWFCACVNLKDAGKKIETLQEVIIQLSNALHGPSATNGEGLAKQIRIHELSEERVLLLINGTEYLTEAAAKAFHGLLGDLEVRLGETPKFNPAIVAAGRLSHPSWENSYSPKMKAVEIEPFSSNPVEEILRKVRPSRGVRDHWYEVQAKQIYACTAGHPGCIAAMVQHLHENHWTIPDPNDDRKFLEVIVPIIEKDILVPYNLDGHVTTNGVDYEQLSRVFLELSTYRIITPELIEYVAQKLGLETDKENLMRLEEHIVNSLLVKWDSDRGWHVMSRSVRQLLERCLSIIHSDKLQRHRYAAATYNDWLDRSQERPARPPVQGDVQISYICEAIYHYVICLSIEEAEYDEIAEDEYSRLAYRLEEYGRALQGSPAQRLGKMLRDRLHKDIELHELVDELFGDGTYNGLVGVIETIR